MVGVYCVRAWTLNIPRIRDAVMTLLCVGVESIIIHLNHETRVCPWNQTNQCGTWPGTEHPRHQINNDPWTKHWEIKRHLLRLGRHSLMVKRSKFRTHWKSQLQELVPKNLILRIKLSALITHTKNKSVKFIMITYFLKSKSKVSSLTTWVVGT